METINNMKFDTSIRVLYGVKEKKGHKTLQETYSYIGNKEDVDAVLDTMLVSYNTANKTSHTDEEFQAILSENHIGIVKMFQIYAQLLEKLMFDGTTEEERKNLMALVEKQLKK